MAKGNNPISYNEVFNITDESAVKAIIANIRNVDKEYVKFSKSVQDQSTIMQESFNRVARDMQAMGRSLNITLEEDRKKLVQLATAAQDLQKRFFDIKSAQTSFIEAQKAATTATSELKNKAKELEAEFILLTAAGGNNKKRLAEITTEAQKLKTAKDTLATSIKKVTIEQGNQSGSLDGLKARIKNLREEYSALDPLVVGNQRKLNLLERQITTLTTEQYKLEASLKVSRNTNKDYAQTLEGIDAKLKQLATEYLALNPRLVENKTRLLELAAQAKALRGEQLGLINTMNSARTTTGFLTGSYKALEVETAELTKKLKLLPDGMSKTNAEANKLRAQILANNDQLKAFDKTLGINTRNVGNYRDALGGAGSFLQGFAVSLGGAFIAFQGLQALLNTVVQSNIEVSDSLADVQRTANLTAKEADNLAEQLKKIDTRTSLKGLLDLAVIGGQLGVPKEELAGFSQAIDQLAVTLSGEITGGAESIAKALGKINAVFKVQQKESVDTETALNKTGSAILRLGQAGLATGNFLQDFTLRVGGAADVAGISLPQILAYAAVLEETGSTAEVAGTAFNRLISSLSDKRTEFFSIARIADSKLTLEEFTKTINTDANKALQQFFAGLNKGGTNLTSFNDLLAELKLKAGPSKNAIIELAKSQELLAVRTKQADGAFKDGTLSAEQFRIKNENLASAFAKLGNAIANGFTDSGFSRSIASFINGLVDGKNGAQALAAEYNKAKSEASDLTDKMNPLIKRYDELKKEAKNLGGETKLNTEKQIELRNIIVQIGNIMPGVVSQFNQYGEAVAISRARVDELTQAQKSLLKAQNADVISKANRDFNELKQPERILQGELNPNSPIFEQARVPQVKNSLERVKGRQYEQAKTIRDVGGDLTAEQKALIEYYEQTEKKARAAAEAVAAAEAKQLIAIRAAADGEAAAFTMVGKSANELKAKIAQLKKELGVEKDPKKAMALVGQIQELKAALKDIQPPSSIKRVLSDFEKLEFTVKKLTDTVNSQAIKGKVNAKTLDELSSATEKLKKAQETGRLAISQSLDPLAKLSEQSVVYKGQLERIVGAGKDASDVTAKLVSVNKELEEVQGRVKIALAETQGQTEAYTATIEYLNQQIRRQAETGDVSAQTLTRLATVTKQLEATQNKIRLAVLQATDPMGYLNAQVDILKKGLTDQAAAGDLSEDSLTAYSEALEAATRAQDRFNRAQRSDPRDGDGSYTAGEKKRVAGTNVQDRIINKNSNKAADGNIDAIRIVKDAENAKIQIQIERLNQQAGLYRDDLQKLDEIETQKTALVAQQEKNRTEVTKAEQEKRNQYIQAGFDALSVVSTGFFDINRQNLENESKTIQEQQEYQLSLVGDNKKAKERIDKEAEKKQKDLKRRQAIADKEQAIFNIALNTAIGVTSALASLPPNIPLSIIIGAIGALQIGFVAARPLPKFEKGTQYAPEGWAVVGEKGSEAIESRDGAVRMSGARAHLTYLKSGDKVHTADSATTKKYSHTITEFNNSKNINQNFTAYTMAAGNINKSKTEYEYQQLRRAVGGNISQAGLEKAFKEAVSAIPLEKHSFDNDGYRRFTESKNSRVEHMHLRNTMGGDG